MSARPEVHEAPPDRSPALKALLDALYFCIYERKGIVPLNTMELELFLMVLDHSEIIRGWETCGTEELECSDGVRIVPDRTAIGALWAEQLREEGCPMRRAERGER